MRVLFIGGTGVISSACTELAVARGIELFQDDLNVACCLGWGDIASNGSQGNYVQFGLE